MVQTNILYPVFSMAFLTLLVGVRMLFLRIKAVRQDGLNPAYFLLNKGGKLPEYLIKTTQHYDNLFEFPVLFYIVCLLALEIKAVDFFLVGFAWAYFITRVIHAYIHMTYNNLYHRRNIFLIGSIILYTMWIKLFLLLIIK